jgi:hypothetical protein
MNILTASSAKTPRSRSFASAAAILDATCSGSGEWGFHFGPFHTRARSTGDIGR